MHSRYAFRVVAAAAAALSAGGFAGAASATTPVRHIAGSQPTGSITVSAAASLTEAFNQLGHQFQQQYKGTTVTFNFGSSSTLETQIQEGAPADVFASADTTNMDKLSAAGDVAGKPVVFARNLLEIAVAKGNPKKIKTLGDTLKPGVQLVLCAPTVPCGKFALQAYQRAGLTVPKVPTGQDVKATLSNVSLGSADAAVVYVTDVKAAKGKVAGIVIPPAQNVVATYPVAVVKSSSNAVAAQAFVKYVASPGGQATLLKFGFLKP